MEYRVLLIHVTKDLGTVAVQVSQSEAVFQHGVVLGFFVHFQGLVVHTQFGVEISLFSVGNHYISRCYAVVVSGYGFLVSGYSFLVFATEVVIDAQP